MNQLSTIVNPRHPGTLPSNTIKNLKNDGHGMAVTTRRGKQTIDPPMLSKVEILVEKDNDEIEVTGESKNATEKEAKITQKVVPMPKTPPPFPQRFDVSIEERLGVDALEAVMINFEGDGIEDYDEFVTTLDSSNDINASSSKAKSAGDIPVPPNTDPASVAEEPNRWCVEDQYQIYRDFRMLNKKEKMARLVTEERRALTALLDFRVPVWHCDRLFYATKTLDIGLIQDEANAVAPRKEPQVEVPPLGYDIVANIEQMQDDDTAPPPTTSDAQNNPS
uniref:Integrase core domain containing protein n=1 Tax=Solanum tuberosum TaxID=4113 RepID=M1DAS9_SOLTU